MKRTKNYYINYIEIYLIFLIAAKKNFRKIHTISKKNFPFYMNINEKLDPFCPCFAKHNTPVCAFYLRMRLKNICGCLFPSFNVSVRVYVKDFSFIFSFSYGNIFCSRENCGNVWWIYSCRSYFFITLFFREIS